MKLSKFTRDERTEQVDAYMFHESSTGMASISKHVADQGYSPSPRGFARQGYIDRYQ